MPTFFELIKYFLLCSQILRVVDCLLLLIPFPCPATPTEQTYTHSPVSSKFAEYDHWSRTALFSLCVKKRRKAKNIIKRCSNTTNDGVLSSRLHMIIVAVPFGVAGPYMRRYFGKTSPEGFNSAGERSKVNWQKLGRGRRYLRAKNKF